MAVKLTGAEYKKFCQDEKFWGKNWFEDEVVFIDRIEQDSEFNELDLADEQIIKIAGGSLYDESSADPVGSYESFVRKWLKNQSTSSFVIEVSKDRIEEFQNLMSREKFKIAKN